MAEPGVVNPLSHFLVYMVTINYGHKSEDSELASRQESPSPSSREAFSL